MKKKRVLKPFCIRCSKVLWMVGYYSVDSSVSFDGSAVGLLGRCQNKDCSAYTLMTGEYRAIRERSIYPDGTIIDRPPHYTWVDEHFDGMPDKWDKKWEIKEA